jgi:hypothetical protein
MNHHAVYVGRRKAVPCIVNGIGHNRNFIEETLEEPGSTTQRVHAGRRTRPRSRRLASRDALISALFEQQMQTRNALEDRRCRGTGSCCC